MGRGAVLRRPLALLFGFAGLGAFWVCQAAPLHRSRLLRSLGTQLLAALLSGALWLAAARGWAAALERLDVFPALAAKQLDAAPLLLGLGVALFLLTSALHYLLMAVGASQDAERRALEFEVASREAELRALRAQIHPHFLFNSLNSINVLIAARPEDARRLCVRLADFLRRSLTLGSRETIPLAEELDLAEQLLSIETPWVEFPEPRAPTSDRRSASSSPASMVRLHATLLTCASPSMSSAGRRGEIRGACRRRSGARTSASTCGSRS